MKKINFRDDAKIDKKYPKYSYTTLLGALFVFWFCNVSFSYAARGVGKVLILRGDASYILHGQKFALQRGESIPEGAIVKTQKSSFVKLIFMDKSTINIAPLSSMKIESFRRKSPGILNLIKGKIRAKVSKNYMNMQKGKSKLFIRTRTAVMGVRGTDFNVIYNPISANTTLLTFSGVVAMNKFSSKHSTSNNGQRFHINARKLEKVVSAPNAVFVRKGQFSSANSNMKEVSVPVRISPRQLKVLKHNDLSQVSSSEDNKKDSKKDKIVRDLAPKGLEGVGTISDSSGVDKVIKKESGHKKLKKMKSVVAKEINKRDTYNTASLGASGSDQSIKPRAGGFVDLETGKYIAPPKGSSFDPNQGVYVINSSLATIDKKGNFKSDIIKIKRDGTIKISKVALDKISRKLGATNRAPASVKANSRRKRSGAISLDLSTLNPIQTKNDVQVKSAVAPRNRARVSTSIPSTNTSATNVVQQQIDRNIIQRNTINNNKRGARANLRFHRAKN